MGRGDCRGDRLMLLMCHPLLPMYHPYGICGDFVGVVVTDVSSLRDLWGIFVGVVVTDVSSLRDLRGILLVLLLPMYHPYGIYGGFLLVPYGICGGVMIYNVRNANQMNHIFNKNPVGMKHR